MNELGKYVREKRKDLALTQEELAKELGVSSITISQLENGKKVGPSTLKKLSNFFKVKTRILRMMMLEISFSLSPSKGDKHYEDNE